MKLPDWLDSKTDGPNADGLWTLTVKPKRWFALYPSFWRFAVRNLRLRAYESPPVAQKETPE